MTPSNNPNYEPITIPVSYAGAYLYQTPHKLELCLDKELAVVFCLKNLSSTGLVLTSSETSQKDLLSELEILHLKIKAKLKIHSEDITLKLFGLSHGALHIVKTVESWAQSLGIKINVIEVGKQLVRNLSVECRTGIVAVTYGEINQKSSKVLFLSEGTARTRIPLAQVHNNILILTHNPVHRQLTKACIEEYPAWAADSVENLSELTQSKALAHKSWSVVLCFEDLRQEKGIETILQDIRKKHPASQIRWVGAALPEFHKDFPELKLLPPIDYELLPDFKKMLKRAVFDSNLALNFETVKMPAKNRSKS
jgi:hypothetical protein